MTRARFYAAIQQQMGVTSQSMFTARTYGELHEAVVGPMTGVPSRPLEAAVSGNGTSRPLPLQHRHPVAGDVSCGIDLEDVAHLPEPATADYWEDAFYRTTFTSREIAYCLLQDNPRMHFAARWCAKEALKKCDPAYVSEPMSNIEMALNERGAPFLQYHDNGTAHVIPVAVSVSHTLQYAAAVVVQAAMAPPPADDVPVVSDVPATSAPSEVPALLPEPPKYPWTPWLLATAAFVLALWALIRSF